MSEITLECKLARDYTLESVEKAWAYLLIKVTPEETVNFGVLPINLALVIDVSGSMTGEKLECAKEAACLLVDSLSKDDRLSVVVFSDDAQVIVPSRPVDDKGSIRSLIGEIGIVGGTCMYTGMNAASREIQKEASATDINRMILFTDGLTEGEERCIEIAHQEARNKAIVSTFGIGEEYNEELLKAISDITLGGMYHLEEPRQIKEQFKAELESATATGITNAGFTIQLAKDVSLEEIHRIFPNTVRLQPQSVDERTFVVTAGALKKTEPTCLGAKLRVPARPPSRVRIAQITLKYDIPSLKIKDGTARSDVVVEYTKDRDLCGRVDKEVMDYFNQLNVQNLIEEATREAKAGNAAGATQKLTQAQMLTQRVGNVAMTVNLERAIGELGKTGLISPAIIKTIKAGATHTVKVSEADKPLD